VICKAEAFMATTTKNVLILIFFVQPQGDMDDMDGMEDMMGGMGGMEGMEEMMAGMGGMEGMEDMMAGMGGAGGMDDMDMDGAYDEF
jgi:hypothetical protein